MFYKKDDLTDEKLMQLYKQGDDEAFKLLYERHSSKIYGFLMKRLNNSEKAAEVYQEVFIKIHKSKHLYNETLPALAWIFTVCRTVMIDELRKDSKIKTADDYNLELIPAPASDVSEARLSEAVEMLQVLPSQQKSALEMRYVDNKTFQEIADQLNVSPVNVRQIISRGIKRLKELTSEGNPNETRK